MSIKSSFDPSRLPDAAPPPETTDGAGLRNGESPGFSHPADQAERLEQLSPEERMLVLRRLPAEEAADALAELDSPVAGDMLENMDARDAALILSEMWIDDAVDILDEVTEGHRDALLSRMPPEDAQELRTLLSFDPDTAAGVMNTEIIMIRADLSVDDAIRQIRAELDDREMPYYVYVVDEKNVLVGVLSLRDLMLSKPGTQIRGALGRRDVIAVRFDADKEEAARMLSHYNFLSLPVVDGENRLMGMVTYDDVMDILQDEATADMLGMVGAGQDESVDTPWLESVKLRLPWLAINMFNSSLSAFIVYMFEGSIAQMAFLAVLMPMVANQAGNTGQQALAVMIRQLATERFDSRKAWIAVLREGKIGLLTGLIMAACAFSAVWLLSGRPSLAGVMSGALLMDMTLGAVAGGSIPLILRAMRRDPAQASSIFLTTLTDGAGFFIFLSMATLFLL
jgi:magnesium transporter